MDITTIATEAVPLFYRDTRTDGARYTAVKDDRPQWLTDLIYAAHGHGEMLPDDHVYELIAAALADIAECDDEDEAEDRSGEWADGQVPAYTSERIAWLGSHTIRAGYCDEAAAEFGMADDVSMDQRIGLGMYHEASMVYGTVLSELRDELERRESLVPDDLSDERYQSEAE